MTGWKSRALQVPPVVPYKALPNFSKALYGATRGTCSTQFFRSVMEWSPVLTVINKVGRSHNRSLICLS